MEKAARRSLLASTATSETQETAFEELLAELLALDRNARTSFLMRIPAPLRLQVGPSAEALTRHADKLPSFLQALCRLDSVSAEQATPEAVARARFANVKGRHALDLTAGLGVDTMALSERFKQVTAIEKDPERAARLRENLRRLKVNNVQVLTGDALELLRDSGTPDFDLVFIDPDRRAVGRKMADWRQAEPNVGAVRSLLPPAAMLWVKMSPAYDFREALKHFPDLSSVQAIAWQTECREIVWMFGEPDSAPDRLRLSAVDIQSQRSHTFSVELSKRELSSLQGPSGITSASNEVVARYLIDASPALRALCLENAWAAQQLAGIRRSGAGGWLLADASPPEGPYRSWELESCHFGSLNELGRLLKSSGIDAGQLSVRGLRAGADEVRKKWKLSSKGGRRLWLGPAFVASCFLGVGADAPAQRSITD